ncbi:MAG: dienelactone hydrolase family protein [Armatimonadetes bacterium]|nr:dienelactone hydrolase family protein [Armatimonadota bacterium]
MVDVGFRIFAETLQIKQSLPVRALADKGISLDSYCPTGEDTAPVTAAQREMAEGAAILRAEAESMDVSFPAVGGRRALTIPARLQIPRGVEGKVPAVVILHGSNGVDGRGAFYAEALNASGIATLEIDMWTPRGLLGGPSGRPKTVEETLPDAFGALFYLAGHPSIDPSRIGVMGFSWGGVMTLKTAFKENQDRFAQGKHEFAAHLAFYPVCSYFKKTTLEKGPTGATGAPVHILAGEKDDYDEPGDCRDYVDLLLPEDRKHFGVTVYPDACHGWDQQGSEAIVYDPAAKAGKGGYIAFSPNHSVAEESREFAVSFFREHFGMEAKTDY